MLKKTIKNTDLYWTIEDSTLIIYEKYMKISYAILVNIFITPFIIIIFYLNCNNSDLHFNQAMINVLTVMSIILFPLSLLSIISMFHDPIKLTVTSNEIKVKSLEIQATDINDINIIEDTFLLKLGRYQTMNMIYKCNKVMLIMKNNQEHEILNTVKENTTEDLKKLKDDILKIINSG